MDELAAPLDLQSGVVSRRQALAAGLLPHDIRRRIRRREWTPAFAGVYVDHNGPLTWLQRGWAAVLLGWPAALCHDSALRASDGPGRRDHDDGRPIHIAVDRTRSVVEPAAVVVHQLADLDQKVQWNRTPPRVRIEHTVLDLAAEAPDELEAIARVANAVQARRTTAPRILEALDTRTRIARRSFLAGVLDDVAAGTCSVLEHGYLTRVERPHGLPVAERQVMESSRGTVYRDVEYRPYGALVELDGRLFHDSAADRDRDLDRDLDSVVDGRTTARLGWGQVFGRPCETAVKVGRLLQRRGWVGRPQPCPECRPGQP